MKGAVFDKTDFVLCDVPVPKGYPQSQTHAGIGMLSNGMYLLTTSPYPNIKYSLFVAYFRAAVRKLSGNRLFNRPAESYENPCIYIGVPYWDKPPVRFTLAHSSPLMNPLDPVLGFPAFNSDPDLFVENDTVYVLNRSIYRMEGAYNYYMRLFLIEGVIQNGYFLQTSTSLLREGKDIVGSQCLTCYKGQYILTDVRSNSYNDGQTFNGIRYISSSTIDGLKSASDWRNINTVSGEFLPWHMSLFQYDGKLYSIIACVKKGEPQRCWQMLGEFNDDLSGLRIYETPLTDFKSYRGAAIVKEDGSFVLYNTTVHEQIKGSRAVDGRNVIMASKPFEDVLSQLRGMC